MSANGRRDLIRRLKVNGEYKLLNKFVNIHVLYLHCGRGFNSTHRRRLNRCLIIFFFLCDNPAKQFRSTQSAEKSGLGGLEMEDRRECVRDCFWSYVSSDAMRLTGIIINNRAHIL